MVGENCFMLLAKFDVPPFTPGVKKLVMEIIKQLIFV